MGTITIGFNNRTDSATLSGGSWLASLPLNNLKDRQVQVVSRSSDATNASTQFNVDFGVATTIGAMALVVHNLSAAAKVRWRGNTSNSFVSPVYNSGWVNAWPSNMIPVNLRIWQATNFWTGVISDQARAGFQSPYILLLDAAYSLRYWLCEIDDTANTDGKIHIGRLFSGAVWTPDANYKIDSNSLGYESLTKIQTSRSGAEYFDELPSYRVSSYELSAMQSSEAYDYFLELQRLSGISGEILIVPDPSDTANMPKRAFMGRLMSMSPIVENDGSRFSATIHVKELL